MEQKKNTDTRKTVRTVTSNDFITAMGIDEMTLKARKLLYIAISQCKKNDQEFFEYQINAKDFAKMDKEYIEKEYEQAIKEYNAALTEDDLDTARRTMKRLEAIAMQDYGFDYADELAMKKEDCKK